ncbi:hypothetical protein DXG01_012840 [Tephrocybe rancida]|nr:hypothetical protein DXG01_012840 [Tephrocybe rancida]
MPAPQSSDPPVKVVSGNIDICQLWRSAVEEDEHHPPHGGLGGPAKNPLKRTFQADGGTASLTNDNGGFTQNSLRHKKRARAQEVVQLLETVHVDIATETLPVAHGRYTALNEAGKRKLTDAEVNYTDEELIRDHGFTELDPEDYSHGRAVHIVDVNDIIIGVVGGQPNDPLYRDAADRTYELMMSVYERVKGDFDADSKISHHKRGHFPALNVGIMHGIGRPQPSQLDNGKYEPLVRELLDSILQRLAGYGSGDLIRWVDNGGRLEKALKKEDPEEFQRIQALKETQWQEGLSLLSTKKKLTASL